MRLSEISGHDASGLVSRERALFKVSTHPDMALDIASKSNPKQPTQNAQNPALHIATGYKLFKSLS